MNLKPRCLATSLPTLVLPDAPGPSIATAWSSKVPFYPPSFGVSSSNYSLYQHLNYCEIPNLLLTCSSKSDSDLTIRP